MKFKRTVLAVSISAALVTLTACGGGGGGGGSSATLSPYVRSEVPFYTPRQITTIDPLIGTSLTASRSQVYTANLSGPGSQEIIVGNSMEATGATTWRDSKMYVLGWENGSLVDKTSQWFPNNINQTVGSTDLRVADFRNIGRDDLFLMPITDNGYVDYAYLYTNTGSNFSRSTINLPRGIWGHDIVTYDLNRDGYLDIVLSSYGPSSTFLINNAQGSFTPYVEHSNNIGIWNASSIAAGDFLNNNTTTLVVTDPVGPGTNAELMSFSIANGYAVTSLIATLPTPRFMLPKWASYNFGNGQGASHEIRAYAYDFNRDGNKDVLIVSRPWLTNGDWPVYSEIQFLKNNGSGNFTDVTDTVLVGYNTNVSAPYVLKFVDFNNDGLTDILTSTIDYNQNNSHQFLIATQEGKYVAAFQNILSEFTAQSLADAARRATTGSTGSVTLIQGPNNKTYLVTYINVEIGGDHQLMIYLSELGSNGFTTAPASVSALRQVWPYMSTASVNDALARTAQTYLGAKIIDFDRVFNPINGLGISLNGRTGTRIMLSGGIALPNAVNELRKSVSAISAIDGIGRDFTVNLSSTVGQLSDRMQPMTTLTEHNTNSSWSSKFTLMPETTNQGVSYSGSGNNFSISADTSSIDPDGVIYRFSHARTIGSPWVAFTGMWGDVKSSSTFEFSATKTIDNWWAQVGILQTTTEINPGLVQKVSPITSLYSVAGYQFDDWNLYAGVKPYIVSGNIEFKLPTQVDTQGTMSYTTINHALRNTLTGFAGINYNSSYRNHRWSFGAVVDTQSKSAVVAKYQWKF